MTGQGEGVPRRSFVAEQRPRETPFHVSDGRVMLSLGPLSKGKYCTYSCPFCYVGGDFLSYASLTVDEIVEWVASVQEPYDVIYVSCDTDSFAPPREAEALALLHRLSQLGVDLLFTTRAVLSDTTVAHMEKIAASMARGDRTLIGCVSLAQLSVPHLEPHPIPSPQERLAQLGRLRAAGLQTVLALRPFLPNVPLDDYRELVRLGAPEAMVVLGGVWYHDRAGVMQDAVLQGQRFERAEADSILRRMDFDSNDAEWQVYEGDEAERAVRQACEESGVPMFMRSRPAIEWLRDLRSASGSEGVATSGG